jgi:hypothetical protein
VDVAGKAAHKDLNFIGRNKLGTARDRVKVHRKRGSLTHSRVSQLEAGGATQHTVDAEHDTEGGGRQVRSEETLLTVGTVLLGAKFDPHVSNGRSGKGGNG